MKTLLVKRTFSLWMLLIMGAVAIAQNYQLTGCVKDETGKPVEVANVILLHAADSTYRDGMITDAQGCFRLEEPKGEYLLRITMMGYEPCLRVVKLTQHLKLDNLTLKTSAVTMEGVTVTAAKPVIRREIDRVVFDAGNSIAAVGGNALDLLRDVPGLRVTQNSVEIIGKGGIKVYINDRETKLSGDDLINFLRSYSASQIGRVEVITTPPARYDAEGDAGIINIRLRERLKDHVGGNIYSSYSWAEKNSYGYSGADLQFNKGRVTAYLGGTGVYGHSGYVERNRRVFTDQIWQNRSETRSRQSSYYLNGGVDVALERQWNVGTQISYGNNTPKSEMNNHTDVNKLGEARIDSFMLARNNSDGTYDRVNANFHVDKSWGDKGRKMIWDVDYLKDKSDTHASFVSDTRTPEGAAIAGSAFDYDKSQRRKVDVVSSAIDFILPSDKYNMTAGAKVSFTDTRNRLVYDNSNVSFTQDDYFRYKEQIYALYADYSRNFGSRFSMKLGLRLEHTRTTGISESEQTTDKHDYTRLFPTVYLMYKPGEDHALNLSFSNRINRPAQNMVNPFVSYENKYSRHRGKEDLKPSYRYNTELSYTFKNNLNFSAYYSYATDVFSQLLMLDEETHILSTLWDNYMKNYSFGINNSYTFRCKWLQTFVQHGLKYSKATSLVEGTDPTNEGWSYNASLQNTIYLNPSKTWVATLSGYYSSPTYESVIRRESAYGASAGVRYALLKNKLNLSLNVSEFIRKNMRGTSYYNGAYMKFNNTFSYTTLRLGVTYNFGADIKRKERTLSNQDVQNRL